MSYYLHRISHCKHWSHPLLAERNLLSYGWSKLAAKPGFIALHQERDWDGVPDAVANVYGAVNMRFGVQRFLQMSDGDRVVVPTWGAFHVYEIASDVRLVPADIEQDLEGLESSNGTTATIRDGYFRERVGDEYRVIDLGLFRRVNLIARKVPREGYADAALMSRLKARQANLQIDDLQESIENAIAQFQAQQPINVHHLIMEKCAPVVRQTILGNVSPRKLEELIKTWFQRQGASAEIPPRNQRKKEGDADIIATFEALKVIVYVQAKRHDGQTNAWAVEQIEKFKEYQSSTGDDDEYTRVPWVISTAEEFSDDCETQARNARVRLVNGIEFATMLLDSGIDRLG